MNDLKHKQGKDLKTQARNIKLLLKRESIKQTQLAKMLGVSTVSVSRWTNGQTAISADNVEQIRKLFPDYSFEFLKGSSEYPNEREEAFMRNANSDAYMQKCSDSLESFIANCCFCSIEKIDASELNSLLDRYWGGQKDALPFDVQGDHQLPRFRFFRNGKSLTLDGKQWDAFVDEVVSYVDMRLTGAMNRGYW